MTSALLLSPSSYPTKRRLGEEGEKQASSQTHETNKELVDATYKQGPDCRTGKHTVNGTLNPSNEAAYNFIRTLSEKEKLISNLLK